VYDFNDGNIKCISLAKNGTKNLLEIMQDPDWWDQAKNLGGWDILLEKTVPDTTHRFSSTIIRPTLKHKNLSFGTKIRKNWSETIGKSSVSNPVEIDDVDSIMNRMGYPMHP
jgi:hypothetical protein